MANAELATLDDGVTLTLGAESVANMLVTLPKRVKPRIGKIRQDKRTKVYQVPKSEIFAYAKASLPDGSVLVVTRYRKLPDAMRQRIFDAMVEKGLRVEPIAASSSKPLTAESLLEPETEDAE